MWERDGRIVRAPEGASRERVTIHDRDAWMRGYRAIMGWDQASGRYLIWLLDPEGEAIHTWPIDYRRIDPDGPLNGRDDPHGMQVLSDGSVLVNFDYGDALARIDPCGDPIWVQPGVFHHLIEAADDGTFWTWLGEGSAISPRQHLVNFDPETGEILTRLDLVDDFLSHTPDAAAIFGLPRDFEINGHGSGSHDPENDIFHPNDVEPLSAERSRSFPDFRPGDLLVSFRNLDLVAVLDPVEKSIRWWRRGPWRLQHDPDFGDDGRIVVFSNNREMGRSTLVALDPEDDEIDLAFMRENLSFFSAFQGLHQDLPNDTRLVVVPSEGRVIEATWEGDLAFEFNNVFSADHNGRVVNAAWLPPDHFATLPTCPKDRAAGG